MKSPDSEDRVSDLFQCEDRIETYFHETFIQTSENIDEDDAVDAYESIIHTAAQSHQRLSHSGDIESILALQLLTKHFNKFPHVQSNVVDVLLSLSRPSASKMLRIHALRSLFHIGRLPSVATTQPMKDNESNWRNRIRIFVEKQLETEASVVLERHLKHVEKALVRKRAHTQSETHLPVQEALPIDQEHHNSEPPQERDPAESFSSTRWFISCPPAPYVFIGNLPCQTTSSELASFLTLIEPSLSSTAVQVKQPPRGPPGSEGRNGGRNTSGFAFVSLPTTQSAKEIIQFVAREPFRGRILNGNFARGPPCNTLLFVQMLPGREFKEEDGLPVEPYDFTSDHGALVWSELCNVLENIGPLKVLSPGKIRFDVLEDAKVAIRKHHLVVEDIVLVPYYDPDEQFESDATRNPALLLGNRQRKRQISEERTQSFALKSGRVVGEDCIRVEEDVGDRMYPNDERIRCDNERITPRNEHIIASPTRWHAKSAYNQSEDRREKPYKAERSVEKRPSYDHIDRSQWHTHSNKTYRPREQAENRFKVARNRSSDRVSESKQWNDRFRRNEPLPRRVDTYQPSVKPDVLYREPSRDIREPLFRGRDRSRQSNGAPRSRSRSKALSAQSERHRFEHREDFRHPDSERRRIDGDRSIAEIAQSEQERYHRNTLGEHTLRNPFRGNERSGRFRRSKSMDKRVDMIGNVNVRDPEMDKYRRDSKPSTYRSSPRTLSKRSFQDTREESDERKRSRPNDCIETQIFVPVEDECAVDYDED
uniref:Uncharacterized protein AlNc14C39G3337 n=1 Tax=Albugo laibachii Nc14 TaxID=890382 RepID=F0W970_9STRA|nr:conserved hypothetical protein [Albugo laibachii Nc14]|eukprot:CCA17683.1 conserved hypothetical protein [Albugo laibachii Nc14]